MTRSRPVFGVISAGIIIIFLFSCGPHPTTPWGEIPAPEMTLTPPDTVTASDGSFPDRIYISWASGTWTYGTNAGTVTKYYYIYRSRTTSSFNSTIEDSGLQSDYDLGNGLRANNKSLYPGIYYYKIASGARAEPHLGKTYYYASDLSSAYGTGSISTYQMPAFNVWTNDALGDVSNSNGLQNQSKWYWINAASNTTYTIFWDEVGGNFSKTAQIDVHAYKTSIETCTSDWGKIPASFTYFNDGTNNTGHTTGRTFTAVESGKIYILTFCYPKDGPITTFYGTFALKVSNW